MCYTKVAIVNNKKHLFIFIRQINGKYLSLYVKQWERLAVLFKMIVCIATFPHEFLVPLGKVTPQRALLQFQKETLWHKKNNNLLSLLTIRFALSFCNVAQSGWPKIPEFIYILTKYEMSLHYKNSSVEYVYTFMA